MACHNGLLSASGEDVSIGTAWRATMMANSARDPYWQASVRREVLDHPTHAAEVEDECSRCHMPMMRAEAHAGGGAGEVFANLPIDNNGERAAALAADGVSCTLCHQIQPSGLGDPASFGGGFVVDAGSPFGRRAVFGPFAVDSGRARIMHSASEFIPTKGEHVRSSELCATCHTLFTSARDAAGHVVGRLPEQVPYLEWKRSAFADSLGCQSCHMPIVRNTNRIASVWGDERDGVARHDFVGGNFFMLQMLNRHRGELGVIALPQELSATVRRTMDHLERATATLTLEEAKLTAGQVQVTALVQNLSGHKLPTAYPSRRAWLHLTVRDARGGLVFESGALAPSGAIAGNDNDEGDGAFEPHHARITSADEVQVYESVMIDANGVVTTGLLSAVRYAKDNRLLPRGFEKRGAPADVAVHGDAERDADFAGGSDRVVYEVALPAGLSASRASYSIVAELRFQPIGYRWAQNLKRHRSAETDRFVSWYDELSPASSVVLARDSVAVR